jgi:hypothetical protein
MDIKKMERNELSPDKIAESIMRRRAEMERVIVERERSLTIAPEGNLRILKNGNFVQYYKKDSSDDTCVYLKRKEDFLAASLAQKAYDVKVVDELKAEIKVMDKFLDNYHPERIDKIYTSLQYYRKRLIHPTRLLEKDYIERWMGVAYEKAPFDEGSPDFFSAKGERVRSKSEVMIADALSRHHIPYRYEYPIEIPGIGTVHPDFTCLNVRERKEYIWEHNGMMSNSNYAEYAVSKIEKYAMTGYLQGKNLILTFETSSYPLTSRVIECNIRKYLLNN